MMDRALETVISHCKSEHERRESVHITTESLFADVWLDLDGPQLEKLALKLNDTWKAANARYRMLLRWG